MDFVSAYIFGLKNGANYTQKPDMGRKFFYDYKARQAYQFWPQDVPKLTRFLSKVGLLPLVIPKWVSKANFDIEGWIISMQDKAEQTVQQAEREGEKGDPQDWPNVYVQLRHALIKSKLGSNAEKQQVADMVQQQRLEVASEMLDHTLAGFDTSSITLTFLAYELSLEENSQWQEYLRAELAGVSDITDAKALDSLPILQAIMMEALRLHAAIPGNQPRVTPPNAQLGPFTNLPANVRVQAQAWSLHRNPDVFPEPETFNPSRWLDSNAFPELATSSAEQLKEMNKWFWAFGSGGRMCVGSNLAMLDMKAIVAGVWANFRTRVQDGRGMAHKGCYVADPVGHNGNYLVLRIEELRDEKPI